MNFVEQIDNRQIENVLEDLIHLCFTNYTLLNVSFDLEQRRTTCGRTVACGLR